eukprot:scaffold136560_cov33-Tisochrysis_lutea.AAC.1
MSAVRAAHNSGHSTSSTGVSTDLISLETHSVNRTSERVSSRRSRSAKQSNGICKKRFRLGASA